MANFNFVFSPQDVQTIVGCLEDAPAKVSRGVLNKLEYQIAEQQKTIGGVPPVNPETIEKEDGK